MTLARNLADLGSQVDSSGTLGIGGGGPASGKMTGYLSNVRIVNGSSPYDATASTITVPTTALTAVTNTALLTCQSNRFIDNSSNNFSITPDGYPATLTFSPVAPTSAYSTATNGGSGYFPRSGSDNLSIASSSAWDLGSDNFTIEAWCYPTLDASAVVTTRANNGSTYPSFELTLYASTWRFYSSSNGSSYNIQLDSGISPLLNVWQHIAVTRSGSTYTIWINGVAANTASSSASLIANGNSLGIGAYPDSANRFKGYISDLRIVKGTALYSSTFTPNTSPLTSVANTQLLCHMTNAGIYDNAMMNDLETVGNAQVSTSVVKYGTGSIAFDGTNSTLTIPRILSQDFNTGNFTIECWIYRNATGGTYFIADFGALQTNGWGLYDDGSLQFRIANSDKIQYNIGGINAWYHIAITRSGSTLRMFVNGNLVGSTTDSTNVTYSGLKYIGSLSNSSGWWSGYIDDFRITKGYARYTANFTPPTAAFANT